MRKSIPLMGVLCVVMGAAWANADDPAPPAPSGGKYVTQEEHQLDLKKQDAMQKEIDELKKQRDDSDAENDQRFHSLKDETDKSRSGTEHIIIAGDASFDFTAQKGSNSSFGAGVAPLILWQPNDKFLFETAFDIGVSTDDTNASSTSFDLTIADGSFLVNDYMAVGGGLFVTPFGVYHNHFDPSWINKFPDDPLAFSDGGIAPGSMVGLFVRGAIPIGASKVTYDVFVSNGPNLVVNDSGTAGRLNYGDYSDLNNDKAIGGRIGYLPMPNLEVGYSVMTAKVNPSGFEDVSSLHQAVDLNYRKEIGAIGGTIDVRTEWVWSHVGQTTYSGTNADGSTWGPLSFGNFRSGGYVQFCYRPTKSDIKFLRDLEFVSRYDVLITPLNAPGGEHEKRVTLGVDYWITPYLVLKGAYEIDSKKVGEKQNAFMIQLGVGL